MQLTDDLIFQVIGNPKIDFETTKDPAQDKAVVEIKGVFTKTSAALLGVDWIFASETVANSGMRGGNLIKEASLVDVELRLFCETDGAVESFMPELCHSWKVSAIDGGGWSAQCKIDVGGNGDRLLDFFRQHRQGFQWTLRPRQANLFDGGTRVDMTPDTPEADETQPEEVDEGATLFDGVFDADEPKPEIPAEDEKPRGRGRPPGAKNKPKPELEPVA